MERKKKVLKIPVLGKGAGPRGPRCHFPPRGRKVSRKSQAPAKRAAWIPATEPSSAPSVCGPAGEVTLTPPGRESRGKERKGGGRRSRLEVAAASRAGVRAVFLRLAALRSLPQEEQQQQPCRPRRPPPAQGGVGGGVRSGFCSSVPSTARPSAPFFSRPLPPARPPLLLPALEASSSCLRFSSHIPGEAAEGKRRGRRGSERGLSCLAGREEEEATAAAGAAEGGGGGLPLLGPFPQRAFLSPIVGRSVTELRPWPAPALRSD